MGVLHAQQLCPLLSSFMRCALNDCTSQQASFNRLKSLPAELGSLPRLEMVRVARWEGGPAPLLAGEEVEVVVCVLATLHEQLLSC